MVSLLAAEGGSAILWVSAIGGALLGFGAVGALVVNWVRDRNKEKTDITTVGFDQLERSIPGLGEMVDRAYKDNEKLAKTVARLEHDLEDERVERRRSDLRVAALVRELATEREDRARSEATLRAELTDAHTRIGQLMERISELEKRAP